MFLRSFWYIGILTGLWTTWYKAYNDYMLNPNESTKSAIDSLQGKEWHDINPQELLQILQSEDIAHRKNSTVLEAGVWNYPRTILVHRPWVPPFVMANGKTYALNIQKFHHEGQYKQLDGKQYDFWKIRVEWNSIIIWDALHQINVDKTALIWSLMKPAVSTDWKNIDTTVEYINRWIWAANNAKEYIRGLSSDRIAQYIPAENFSPIDTEDVTRFYHPIPNSPVILTEMFDMSQDIPE